MSSKLCTAKESKKSYHEILFAPRYTRWWRLFSGTRHYRPPEARCRWAAQAAPIFLGVGDQQNSNQVSPVKSITVVMKILKSSLSKHYIVTEMVLFKQ